MYVYLDNQFRSFETVCRFQVVCDVDLYYEWFFYLRQHFLLIFFIF
jgi:hypothetical protein